MLTINEAGTVHAGCSLFRLVSDVLVDTNSTVLLCNVHLDSINAVGRFRPVGEDDFTLGSSMLTFYVNGDGITCQIQTRCQVISHASRWDSCILNFTIQEMGRGGLLLPRPIRISRIGVGAN